MSMPKQAVLAKEGFDPLARLFLAVGGVFFCTAVMVGFSFLASHQEQSVPVCASGDISGYQQGPLTDATKARRIRIIAANAAGNNIPMTPYQSTAILDAAAATSRVNYGVTTANIGLSASGSVGRSLPGNRGVGGQPLGGSTASALFGHSGIGAAGPLGASPSSAQHQYQPCGPSGGPPRAPSLSTNGPAATLSNAASYIAGNPIVAPISGGIGTNNGVAAALAGGGSAPAFGMFSQSSLSSQAATGRPQSLQMLFSSAGTSASGSTSSPVMGGPQVGGLTAPYGQSAMSTWVIGGLNIPASTPSANDQASDATGGVNSNDQVGIAYLGQYASPDGGIAYIDQVALKDGAVTYSSSIANEVGGFSSGQTTPITPAGANSSNGSAGGSGAASGSSNGSSSSSMSTNLSSSAQVQSSSPSSRSSSSTGTSPQRH